MVNKVTLIGRLGQNPEVRSFNEKNQIAKFSLATNEAYKDKGGQWVENTEWHNIVLWGSLAERAEKQLKKGNLVYLEGKLSTSKWKDKNNDFQSRTEVRVTSFKLLSEESKSKPTDKNGKMPFVVTPSEQSSDDLPF